MSASGITIKPGDLVLSKYRVDRVLGEGAMGVVLAVTNVDLEQRFAVKIMRPSKAAAESHQRFVREARIAARLRSEYAVKVVDVGTTETGEPYMLMEHLDGHDLAAELRARGRLVIADAVGYVLEACEALAEAHAAGIVHRDIKPANLFLARGPGGRVVLKVLDFGISKLADDVDLTGDLAVLGSPLYMSPEQMRSSKTVDARCDVWALGVTLYELLAGKTPFHADKVQAVCARVALEEPPPLGPARPDLPAGLEAVIMACLQKDPARRWPNMAALAAALVPYGGERARWHAEAAAALLGEQVAPARPTDVLPPQPSAAGTSARTTPLLPALTGTTGAAAMAQATLAPVPAKRRRGLAAALAAVAAGGALAAGLLGGRGRSTAPEHGAATVPPPPASSPALPPAAPPPAVVADAGPPLEPDAGAPAKTTTTTAPVAPDKSKPAAPKLEPKPKPEPPAEPPKPPPVKPPGTTYSL
jgi:serine/threonine-protein kinase